MINRVLVFDPVPLKGGSKKVMNTILEQLPHDVEIWVISNDKASWGNAKINFINLFSPHCLQNKTTGLCFYLKHLMYFFVLMTHMIKLKRFSKVIGISGPSVDFALYILTSIINIDVIQLVQGNISNSHVADFGLNRATQVFYLPSTLDSILSVLKAKPHGGELTKVKFHSFLNGIDCQTIKPKNKNTQLGFLWAASLLKWKRLELFTSAIAQLNNQYLHSESYFASVCYIEPKTDKYLDINTLKQESNIYWYEDPDSLNDIRANSSVFISTAESEPFGLSILEAMTAGLAIVIPADNAYWDQQLIDGYNCVKYDAGNGESLAQALTKLIDDRALLSTIAKNSVRYAQQYCHLHCYDDILKSIPN